MTFEAELRRHLRHHGVTEAQLEASVRAGSAELRGDRMMIERAPAAVVETLREALAVPPSRLLDRALEACGPEIPLIAGWDLARACLKVYVNASDAPEDARVELAARFELDGAPHVIGVNAMSDGRVELKRYDQVRTLPSSLLEPADDLIAGRVASAYADGRPHAWFVALRPASPARLDAAFGHLPGFSWETIRAHAPFPPASPRSIGVLAADPARWTAYVKPRHADAPALFSLEPAAVVRAGAVTVSFFLAPDAETPRAFARAAGRALSYRAHGGAPTPELLEWSRGLLLDSPDPPPAPWALESPIEG